VGTARGAGAVA